MPCSIRLYWLNSVYYVLFLAACWLTFIGCNSASDSVIYSDIARVTSLRIIIRSTSEVDFRKST